MKQDTANVLDLVQEAKIGDLIKGAGDERYEASGVHLKDGYLHIVFDNTPRLLRIRPEWCHAGEETELLDLEGTADGYEDITYQVSTGQWYCLIEAAETKSGVIMPRVDVFDDSFAFIRSHWLDFPLKAGNKGFEGLSTLHHAGEDYLLGLCEGNDCKSGKEGAQPGKGRIQVFKCAEEQWEYAGTIRLPEAVQYKDYASLDFRNGFLAVISQASSALWVGRIRPEPASLEEPFQDDGQFFVFPRDDTGRIMYCNPEGVTWIGNDLLVVVSDKRKTDQPRRCSQKEQSIHIFKIPARCIPTK
jgi:hypothetical protein